MKRLLRILMLMSCFIGTWLMFGTEAEAATVKFRLLGSDTLLQKDDGTGAMVDVELDMTSPDFAEVSTLVGTDKVLAYVKDPEKLYIGLHSPGEDGINEGDVITIVTTDTVDTGGAIGTHHVSWFVEDQTLYFVSTADGAELSDEAGAAACGDSTRNVSFTGTGFDKLKPSMEKGDLTTDHFGMKPSEVGDEKTYSDDPDKYYDYTSNPENQKYFDTGAREPFAVEHEPWARASRAKTSGGVLDAGEVPWIGQAGSIKTVIFGTRISVTGNIAQLFNGSTGGTGDDRYKAVNIDTSTKVEASKYTLLENVKIYSDFSGVTSMAGTFARCPELLTVCAYTDAAGTPTSAEHPFSLPALETTAFMFYGCEKLNTTGDGNILKTMDLSSGTLKNTKYMYAGCRSLAEPNIKDYNMAHVMDMDGMFQGATNAAISFEEGSGASVANWNVGEVLTAMYAFAGVIPKKDGVYNYDEPNKGISPGLGEIEENHVVAGPVVLSNWNLTKCMSTYHMFAQNLGVTGVTFNTSYPALIDAAGMFNGCDNLGTVVMKSSMPALKYAHAMFRRAGKESGGTADLTGWNVPDLVGASYMFELSGYRVIDLNNSTDMSSLKEAIAMFADNTRLTSLGSAALGGWRLNELTDCKYMFDGDSALTAVNVTLWGMPKVTTVSHMFSDCQALDTIDTAAWTIGTGGTFTDMECFAYNTGITAASMRDWDTTDVTNMYWAFAKCPELTTAVLPSKQDAFYKVKDTNGMFFADRKLRSVKGTDTSKYAAPELLDARGMFADDVSLEEAEVSGLVQAKTTDIAYMFRRDAKLPTLDISGWNTSGVRYMEGIFDGCNILSTLTPGSDVSGVSLINMGRAFRDCYVLSSASLNGLLAKLRGTTALVDMYEAFLDCYALTSLDMSAMDLSACKDLVHVAYMEEDPDRTTNKLVTIKVPDTILTATGVVLTDASDGNGTSINMFWVDGDGAADGDYQEDSDGDDLLTTFYVNGDIPANLAAYDFGGDNGDNDNRSFIVYEGRTINGQDKGDYKFTSEDDKAVLKISASSTFYKDGTDETATNVPPAYSWKKDGTALGGTAFAYTTDKNAAGTYKATAKPGTLTGSNKTVDAQYILTAATVYEKKIEAEYKGDNIYVGEQYSKDDVEVIFTKSNGTTETLTSDQFTVNSQNVTKEGENEYTVTYDPGDGALTDKITVIGVKPGTPYITATYNGGPVAVSENYAKSDVKVTYTDAKGKKTVLGTDDFNVDSLTVKKLGDNTYTASYRPTGSTEDLTDKFTVKGINSAPTITAEYTGDSVPVGNNYSKDDVKVTYISVDGKKTELTSDDFTVDSQTVKKAGDNTYTASYKTAEGTITAKFKVPGKRIIGSIKAEYGGPAVQVGKEYNTSDVTVTAYYADDTAKVEGFTVTPSSFSGTKVTATGDNTFTVTYKDPDQNGKAFTSQFKVNGYKNVTSMVATYTGDKVKVGESYDKKKVKVTLYYDDGTTGTTENFTVDSTVVTGEGSNSYTATYRDPYGNTLTAGFTVPGYKKDSSSSSSSSSGTGGNNNGNGYNGYGDYAGVSSIFPGTGYAASVPVGGPGGVGVSSGIVQTGTTLKSVLYAMAGIILLSMLIGALWARFGKGDKDEDKDEDK